MKSTKDYKKYLKNMVRKIIKIQHIFNISQTKKEDNYKYSQNGVNNAPNINYDYFLSQDFQNIQSASSNNFKIKDLKGLNDLNDMIIMGDQRNSGFIFNNTEISPYYNNIIRPSQNDLKSGSNSNQIKYGGESTFNQFPNYFKKINNIYESNYTHKHKNTNSKSDLVRAGKIPMDKNYRNTINTKIDQLKNKKQIKSFNYSNNLNFINNRTSLNKSHQKEMPSERSNNKDYRFRKVISNIDTNINNHISLNDLIINKQNNINNKSIDLQTYEFNKKSKEEKDNTNKNGKYHNKISINKSMDSKRLLNKNYNYTNNIIHTNNNGKIINLSNLNNLSYATEKYNCYYENKRENQILNTNDKKKNQNSNINSNINIKNNINNKNKNYYTNKKTEKKEENLNKTKKKTTNMNININPILFTKQYPKKENIKYPLRINYTSENLSNTLEAESLVDGTEEKESVHENKNNEKNIISKHSKNISKTNLYNSFNNDDDNIKFKKKKIYQIHKNNNKKVENLVDDPNKIKNYYHTERISSNNIDIRNNSLTKTNKNIIHKNYNIYFNREENDIDKNSFKIDGNKKEIKNKNNIPKMNLITNHDSLSFKSIKNEKKNYNLKIKNNDRLMFINNENHNKINSAVGDSSILDKKTRTYKISSHVVNEQFYKEHFEEKEIDSSDDDNVLRMSMQSLNDSKIMEIANRYITDEENLDKNEIIEILNCKKDKN